MSNPLYRFRIVSGPASGRTFTVNENGALIGRAANCDIVILDPALSRNQCRIFLRDGLLWVADLKSVNETLVDNETIKEAPLWKDRRITIGETVILVESDAGTPRAARHPSSAAPAITLRQKILLISILAIFVILLIPRCLQQPPPPDVRPLPAEERVPPIATPGLEADYYRTITDTNTIRRFHFRVLPSGNATIHIEDLAQGISLQRTTRMPSYQADLLTRHITEAGFFSLPSTTNTTGDDLVRLTVSDGMQTHTVTQYMGNASAMFQSLCHNLEHAADALFGPWVHDPSHANLETLAAIKYETALDMANANRPDRYEHLYEAIVLLREAQWLAHSLTEPPAFVQQLPTWITRYEQALDAHLRDLFAEADQAAEVGDGPAAIAALETILQRLPDRSDMRYRTAVRRLAEHQEHEGQTDATPEP